MKRYNMLFTFWIIIVVIIFAFLIAIGFIYKKKIEIYKDYEVLLVNKTKKYIKDNNKYPKKNETKKIDLDTLIKEDYLSDDEVVDSCKGYVQISHKDSIKYNAVLSCKYYKTKTNK